jgi:hypothetical protein
VPRLQCAEAFPAGIVVGSIELSETGDSLLHHCLYLRVV